ncbi:MAG: iron chelate uptake ABC transporter family permease subunit [Alkalibacterium sp.]|nr:iron chelate uptake ABC transporter family permease subunit [Alkalibacterium sp.]
MKRTKNNLIFVMLMSSIILFVYLYLTVNTRGHFAFAFRLRSQRIIPFFLVGFSSTVATIVFQTMTQNVILTPNIIGLDSLYILLQTVVFFFFGLNHILVTNHHVNFIVSLLLMIGGSMGLFWLFFKKYPGKIYLMLMTGLILGTFFSSFTNFLQVLIDPNDFESLFARTIASFNRVDVTLVTISLVITIPILFYLFKQSATLDILHLGRAYALSLGIQVDQYFLKLFILVSVLTAVSTALVGPVSFLGFIGANISYRLFKTYRHSILFLGGSLISVFFILSGQMLVEHVFKLQTTLGVIIQFAGGIYFLIILLKERTN